MQEGDAAAADPDPRLAVDQLQAGGPKLLQGRVDVADRVGDVVEARALALEELADGGLRTERPQQLNVTVAEQNRLDALLLDGLAVGERHRESALVEAEGGVDVLDGDAHVVDPSEHRRQSMRPRREGSRPAPRP